MIRNITTKFVKKINQCNFCQQKPQPKIYSNNKSVISISQWWNGMAPRPTDYYVQDTLEAEIVQNWTLSTSIYRVVFQASLNDPSMDININTLKKSMSLNQLIQLSANYKEKLVNNPSTIIIKPVFDGKINKQTGQIGKNIMELDKLFQQAVGLKVGYLIDRDSLKEPEYLQQISKKHKAISSDVALEGQKLANLVFEHGYRLEHVFYSSPFTKEAVPTPDLQQILSAMQAINYRGKLIFSQGQAFKQTMQTFESAAKKVGYTLQSQYSLQTDGWYTMI